MTTTAIPFGTRLVGQTEKTLTAILERLLAGSGINEPEWVGLIVTIHGGPAPTNVAAERIAAALKKGSDSGFQVLANLTNRGFIEEVSHDEVAATAAGTSFHDDVQDKVAALTDRLWGDVPQEQQEAAAAVLNLTLMRADLELDRLRS